MSHMLHAVSNTDVSELKITASGQSPSKMRKWPVKLVIRPKNRVCLSAFSVDAWVIHPCDDLQVAGVYSLILKKNGCRVNNFFSDGTGLFVAQIVRDSWFLRDNDFFRVSAPPK